MSSMLPMQLGGLVADANGRTRGETCGLPPTWLNATACDGLEHLSIYLYLSRKHKNTNKAITYSGQDSEITMVLNTALITQKRQKNYRLRLDEKWTISTWTISKSMLSFPRNVRWAPALYAVGCESNGAHLHCICFQLTIDVARACSFQRPSSTSPSTRQRTCLTWSKTRWLGRATSTCSFRGPAGSFRCISKPETRLTSTWCTSRFDRTSSTETCLSSPTKLCPSLLRSVRSPVNNGCLFLLQALQQ